MGCMDQRVPVFTRNAAQGVRVDTFCWLELMRISRKRMGKPTFKYISMDLESHDKDELRKLVFKLCDIIC